MHSGINAEDFTWNNQYKHNDLSKTTMKEIKKIATAENFTAVSVGKLNELDDYVLELTPEIKIPREKYFAEHP